MPLTLYSVTRTGNLNIADLVAPGVKFYTADTPDDEGTIVLTPVKVVSPTTARRAEASDSAVLPDISPEVDTDSPWIGN